MYTDMYPRFSFTLVVPYEFHCSDVFCACWFFSTTAAVTDLFVVFLEHAHDTIGISTDLAFLFIKAQDSPFVNTLLGFLPAAKGFMVHFLIVYPLENIFQF